MIGYDQQNHHHSYDLWEHTVRGVEGVPADPVLRLTMLLHDTGKPAARTTDEKGEGHYYGHPKISEQIARKTADTLRLDNNFRDRLCNLVLHHDIPLRTQSGEINTDRSFLLCRLNKFGEEDLRAIFLIHCSDRTATGYTTREREDLRKIGGEAFLQLMEVQRADALGKGTFNREEVERAHLERTNRLRELMDEHPCVTLKDLAVNGRDLLAAGLKGKAVGETLQALLEAVMDGRVPNEKGVLLSQLAGNKTDV